MKSRQFLFVLSALFFFNCYLAGGQTIYDLNSEDSKIWVDGTSTLKNWSGHVQAMSGTITVDSNGSIEDINLAFDASTMEGGRGADMDKKIYKALKTDENPMIIFKGYGTETTAGHDLAAAGSITIAGTTESIVIEATGSLDTKITGSYPMKLSTYKIEPPTALFGQIVTHDDITLQFDLSFNKRSL